MNILCDNDLMEALCGSDELEVFTTPSVITMIDYKWGAYAEKSHGVGCLIHVVYILALILFINDTYLMENIPPDQKASPVYMVILFIGLIYPLLYDGTQMIK